MAGLEYGGSCGKMKIIKLGIGRVRNFMLRPPPPQFPHILLFFFFFLKQNLERKTCDLRKRSLEVICMKFDIYRSQNYGTEKREKQMAAFIS